MAEAAGLPEAVGGLKKQLFYKNRKNTKGKAFVVMLQAFNM